MAVMPPPTMGPRSLPGDTNLDGPPPLPDNLGKLRTMAGQSPELEGAGGAMPPGAEGTRMLLERAMLTEKVITSLAEVDPGLAGLADQMISMLRSGITAKLRAGQPGSASPMTPGNAPMPGGMA